MHDTLPKHELVGVMGKRIRKDILAEVKKAKLFSVIANEVTDASNKAELSLSLRSVLNDDVREGFVNFVEVEKITGSLLAQAILQWHGLSPADIRGQCYDGAPNMSRAVSEFKTVIQQKAHRHCIFTVWLIA